MSEQRKTDSYEQWEDALIRQAMLERIEEEIAADEAALDDDERARLRADVREMRPRIDRRMDRMWRRGARKKRLRQGLRGAFVAVAVLAVAFSGVCLASPAIRERVISLVERNWGSYTEIHVERGAPEETAEADEQSKITVDPDDPRLRYVNPNWCLHYYPLDVYDIYRLSEVTISGSYTSVNPEDGFYYHYMTEEQRAQELNYDKGRVIFTMPGGDSSFHFIEDGRSTASFSYDKNRDNVKREIIDGKEVFVSEKVSTGSGGYDSYYTCFRWWEDGHLLTLTGNLPRWEMEWVFKSVERIR